MKRNFLQKAGGKRSFFFVVFLLCAMLLQAGCAGQTMKYTAVNTAMGTVVTQTVYAKEEAVTGQITELITSLEQEYLSWRIADSEVAGVNAAAGSGEFVALSEEFWTDLQILQEVSAKSEGAFDMTLGALIRLWNIDAWAAGSTGQTTAVNTPRAAAEPTDAGQTTAENILHVPAEPTDTGQTTAENIPHVPAESLGSTQETLTGKEDAPQTDRQSDAEVQLPTPEEIEAALQNTGYERLEIAGDGIRLPVGMSLDLGAVGKGIACDRIRQYLEEKEVSGAVISVGGSILTFGQKPDGTNWQVGIVNPLQTEQTIGILSLSGQWCVSTSGDYERFVEVDDFRYHHILDPATGYPADSGVRSVTILCKSGILSDALSTACFVLGTEKGMELAESYGAEALFVDAQGKIYMTEGMKQYFRETGEK